MNRPLFVVWLLAAFAVGCLVMSAVLIHPAFAAECTNYDVTVAAIERQGHKPFFISPERLPKVVADAEVITGETYGVATRGFLIVGETITVLGLEVSGCLLDPIRIQNPKPDGAA